QKNVVIDFPLKENKPTISKEQTKTTTPEEIQPQIDEIEENRKVDLAQNKTLIDQSTSIINFNKKRAESIKQDIESVVSGENKKEDLELFENISDSLKFTG